MPLPGGGQGACRGPRPPGGQAQASHPGRAAGRRNFNDLPIVEVRHSDDTPRRLIAVSRTFYRHDDPKGHLVVDPAQPPPPPPTYTHQLSYWRGSSQRVASFLPSSCKSVRSSRVVPTLFALGALVLCLSLCTPPPRPCFVDMSDNFLFSLCLP